MELNHKVYEIYGAENAPVEISNPKETQIIINGKPNGAMLSDVFKKIDDLEVGKIFGWSILEYYKAEEGCLCDNEGNKITLLEGETEIFFKRIKDPLIILNEKDVNLDYVRDVSSLLGLGTIEETITGLPNDDMQILVEERMVINEKRQKQIQKEKADADARERQKLDAEQKRLEREKAEEEERLAKLEEERIAADEQARAEAETKAKEEEDKAKEEEEKRLAEEKVQQEEDERLRAIEDEKARKEAEAIAIAAAEEEAKNKTAAERAQLIAEAKDEARREFEAEMKERNKQEAEEKRKEQEEAEKNKKPEYDAKQFRSLKRAYEENEIGIYATEDGKYTFFYAEEMPDDEEPFVAVKRENGHDDVEGEVTETTEKFVEFEFKDKGQELVVVLNKVKNTIKVEVID